MAIFFICTLSRIEDRLTHLTNAYRVALRCIILTIFVKNTFYFNLKRNLFMAKYYHNRYHNPYHKHFYNQLNDDISKPYRLFGTLIWKAVIGIILIIFLMVFINPQIETLFKNSDTNSIMAPITNVIIQHSAESLLFLELSIFLWWIYVIILIFYYLLRPETADSLSNQEIRSKGRLTSLWTDILPFLLSALVTYITC